MSSLVNHPPIKRFEVTCVYSPPDATVDIVLVHGLNGHPEKTWTAKNGVFWPTDLLPASLKGAKARILVYGYNADVYAFGSDKSASSDMIHQHAQTLVSGLAIERLSEDCGDNPIIWVVHSLGGILLKRALELSNDLTSKSADPSRSIYVSTYGIIFLGTPHTGADPAKWAAILQGMADAIIPKKVMDTEPQLLQTLKSNNEILQNINLHFLDIYQRFEIDMVHESVKTDMKGFKAFVVDQTSASPQLPGVRYYGIEASHSTMCKFESKSAPGYLNVATTIRTWVIDCPPVIQSRWTAERRARKQTRENEAKELLGIYADPPARPSQGSSAVTPELSNSAIISTSMIQSVASIEPEITSETYFIKPPGFRPNSLFKFREAELVEMHRMLFDKKRRAEGTSAVLLQCLPGGGKSCLARQYVYTHFDDFPGGVFWVRAKSQEQLEAGFWEIARKVALKPSRHDGSKTPPRDPEQFITVVRDWFNANHEWLLVLDGIHFDHSEKLRRFIPDSKNTSLIYTSTERGVGGDHHFMNPQVIRIPLLSAREAQELFLLELEKKNPTTDDLKHSMELVQRMGFLPLVIHAFATRLKATDEPLAKFARAYLSGPKLRDLDTYKAVVDQLKEAGAYEALNLINIICFFSQHIPVEMISLGLRALDVPTKAFEKATGRALNNTIRILNQFALTERNEVDWVRSSQDSRGIREFLSDEVDVIKVHSVVQDFFVDSLRADNQLAQWLSRAVVLFRCSYETANIRISSKTNAGLVGDYRSYEIHGKRLLDHLTKHEKKSPALIKVRETLQPTLESIGDEIERRTKESSHGIVQGREDAYQTSIFDRTSSSSDTGPETPSDKLYTWGIASHEDQFESPTSIIHESGIYKKPLKVAMPTPTTEDPGYDSDREDGASTLLQPSQRTPRPDDPMDLENDWLVVRGRRARGVPPPLDLHRTVKVMERHRYHDSAGAWRAVNPQAADPRVSREVAEAFIPKTIPRAVSRGRMSGKSQAEVALSQINKNSPPPARGGGRLVVQDRSRPPQPRRTLTDRGHLMAGDAAYAPAEIGETRYAVSPLRGTQSRSTIGLGLRTRPSTPAMNSLERFPHSLDEYTLSATKRMREGIHSPPEQRQNYAYPSTIGPSLADRNGFMESSLSSSLPIYTRKPSPLPTDGITPRSSNHRRGISYDYPGWHARDYPDPPYPSDPPHSPFSNPETSNWLYDRKTRLGVFEKDRSTYQEPGYSSQPMSRDPSGGYVRGEGIRRSSFAETEPTPDLPSFSPRIAPTSYQLYENMREREEEGPMRKSPRFAFARAALAQRAEGRNADGENTPPLRSRTRSLFNPTAPVFLPRAQSQPPLPSTPPPRHRLPNVRLDDRAYRPQTAEASSSALPQSSQPASIPMSRTASGSHSGSGGSGSGSGGVRIGRRMIAFGDFPEPVDPQLARERAERQREDISRERTRELLRAAARRNGPVPMPVPIPTQTRAVSDIDYINRERERELELERERERMSQSEGRIRRLNSPERMVSLGVGGGGDGGAGLMGFQRF